MQTSLQMRFGVVGGDLEPGLRQTLQPQPRPSASRPRILSGEKPLSGHAMTALHLRDPGLPAVRRGILTGHLTALYWWGYLLLQQYCHSMVMSPGAHHPNKDVLFMGWLLHCVGHHLRYRSGALWEPEELQSHLLATLIAWVWGHLAPHLLFSYSPAVSFHGVPSIWSLEGHSWGRRC